MTDSGARESAQGADSVGPSSWKKPLGVAIATSALVTVLSYVLPDAHAATGVGLAFFGVTWWVALRRDEPGAGHFGLSMGGVFEREPLDFGRMARTFAVAAGWALLLAAAFYPPFWIGYLLWWKPAAPFMAAPLPTLGDDVIGQLLVIALPEEAFYRGYLQTAFDDVFKRRVRVLGAELGPGLILSAVLFALGHVATQVHPNRLAVFFPALLFGWLRARTGGIGAGVIFHALCNLFASYLARSYGLFG